MTTEDKSKFLAGCKRAREEREEIYKKTGGQSVWVKIPLLDALLLFAMSINTESRHAVKKEGIERTIVMLEMISLEPALCDGIGKSLGVEDAMERVMANCPDPWKYELCSSMVSAMRACNPDQLAALTAALCKDVGLVTAEKN
jgi:hypothetical protein